MAKDDSWPGGGGNSRRDFMKAFGALAVYSSPLLSLLAGPARTALANCSDQGGETEAAPGDYTMIERIIGGVNNDTSKQAVQLDFISSDQCVMGMTVVAYDAAGANPVELITFPSEVGNHSYHARVLLASAALAATHGPAPDFVMGNLIPASYLAAGSLTLEFDSTPYWRVAWGGASYTGSTSAAAPNDADGDVSPPFAGGLPLAGLNALYYSPDYGESEEQSWSTSSEVDYHLTSGPAVLTNNAGETSELPVTLQIVSVE